jgi:alpha-maltose-1-phosphate synthase
MTPASRSGPSVMLVHATGNVNVRQTARSLFDAGILAGFFTSIAWQPDTMVDRILPSALRKDLGRRSFPGIPRELIHSSPLREIGRLCALRMGWRNLVERETGIFSLDAVIADLQLKAIRKIARGSEPDAVYGYGNNELFIEAQRRGIHRIYDLLFVHHRVYRPIVEAERELRPEWAPTLTGLEDSDGDRARQDRDLELAEVIVVASRFTAESLKRYPGTLTPRIFAIPYGAPSAGPLRLPTCTQDPLRVLYVGKLTQQKGIGYLFEAAKMLDRNKVRYSLTVLGRPPVLTPELNKALASCCWIDSAPHSEVLKLMREHDVLVFPTLFDGFGLVILEAMAQGTVVIATPNCAAPEIYDDGREGFIVPIRSPEGIAQRLTQLAEDRDLLATLSEAARFKAISHDWVSYRNKILNAVQSVFRE